MKRFLVPLIAFVALAVVLVVGLNRVNDKRDTANRVIIHSPLLGKQTPAFSLPNLFDANIAVTQESQQGRWRLLNVWGTWCSECREEHNTLMAIKNEGRVAIVGLDWKDEDASAVAWLAQLGNPYAVVASDHDGKVAIDYGVYGAPESFLINPQGIVVEKQIGGLSQEIWQNKFLPYLVANNESAR
jgi:cytochrome c biogenesis protein CcmG/thiol:disulfide interchange protein DsbE